jgi:hypothetical protein
MEKIRENAGGKAEKRSRLFCMTGVGSIFITRGISRQIVA